MPVLGMDFVGPAVVSRTGCPGLSPSVLFCHTKSPSVTGLSDFVVMSPQLPMESWGVLLHQGPGLVIFNGTASVWASSLASLAISEWLCGSRDPTEMRDNWF